MTEASARLLYRIGNRSSAVPFTDDTTPPSGPQPRMWAAIPIAFASCAGICLEDAAIVCCKAKTGDIRLVLPESVNGNICRVVADPER
eukprot:CAMPEP_0170215390 /NCGR_PEP_ID=MMETSP0116_2-20130129/7331_1 /TAXON_ID=400756 /ORGANISM="Durinskia baltica, Strain CSIRO CS-38" /LENGTH=87 /DNA_ID=CAMNT_0010465965 /DNA_START=168 /DNA_END=431 /DNA_ORIENTATION=+